MTDTELTQANVIAWVRRAFGEACATDTDERGSRLVEEAIEAAQACGVSREKIDVIADRVYSRPTGKLPQEIGGTLITIYALAECCNIDMQAEALKEWRRICSLPQSYWDRKHAEKHAAGTALPVPGVSEQDTPEIELSSVYNQYCWKHGKNAAEKIGGVWLKSHCPECESEKD